MKKTTLALAAAGLMLFTASCNKDKDDNTNTGSDPVVDSNTEIEAPAAKESVSNTFSSARTEVGDMKEDEGMQAAMNLAGLLGGSSSEMRVKKSGEDEEGLDLDELMTYELEYNFSKDDFDTVSTSADHLIIHFPSTEDGDENDAVLHLNSLEIDEEDEMLTDIDLSVSVEGTKIIAVDASIDYDDNSDLGLEKLDGYVMIGAYEMEASFEAVSKAIELAGSFKVSESSIFDVDVEVAFDDSDYEELTSIDGHVAVFNLKIEGDIDAEAAMGASDEEDLDALNDAFDLEVRAFDTDAKYGDLEVVIFDEDDEDGGDILIVYNDGSEESLLELAEEMVEDLEEELEEFEEIIEELGGDDEYDDEYSSYEGDDYNY